MTETPAKRRMLSPEQIEQGIAEIAEFAQNRSLPVLLVGGVALQQYGSDRFTADLDFAAPEALPELPPEKTLSFGGYQSHTPTGVPVDWIVRADDYQPIFEEAIQHPHRIAGLPVPIVAPEYLVAMKMVARRRKDELDLETLLELGVVDTEQALRLIKRLLGPYAADDLRSHLDILQWRRSRPS